MGQEQSQVDESAAPGFNPDVAPGRKPKAKPKGQAKRGARPREKQDQFFVHTEVKDHIVPIYDDGKKKGKRSDGELAEDVDISKLLDEFGKGKKQDSDGDLELRDIPDQSEGESTDSEDDDDDGQRGLFHHEVEKQKSEELTITNPKSHPIAIDGEVSVGNELICVDHSEWIHTFPIHKIEWFLGLEIGNQSKFVPYPTSTLKTLVIPPDAVGKYIQCQATRRVEDQLHDTYMRHVEGGVFDPHLQRTVRHTAAREDERRFVDVKAVATVGPVLISDEWAYHLVGALCQGSMSAAVKLRDEPTDPGGNFLDESYSRERAKKIAALFKVTFESAEFHYEHPAATGKSSTSLSNKNWISRVVEYVTGDNDEEASRDEVRSSSKRKKKGGADVKSGSVKFVCPLKKAQFRPTTSKNVLVMATTTQKTFARDKNAQDIIRFDVDPKVGRDLLLHTILGFQAALQAGDIRQETWREISDMGDLDTVKHLLQRYLEALTQKTSVTETAYEELPVTPWNY